MNEKNRQAMSIIVFSIILWGFLASIKDIVSFTTIIILTLIYTIYIYRLKFAVGTIN